MLKVEGRENVQEQSSCPNSDVPKKDHLCALQSQGGQESSPDAVIVMLQVYPINVYALLGPGSTFSFESPLVAIKFYIVPYVLHEPFLVSTLVCDPIVTKRVYRSCPIPLPNRVRLDDLVEHDM